MPLWRAMEGFGDRRAGRVAAWAGAAALNAALFALLTLAFDPPPPRGRPDPVPVVMVRLPPPPAPDAAAEPVADTEPMPEAPPAPAAEAPLPPVDLPDVAAAKGAPNGLVGVDCYAVFADPDRAAECAGREVRTDWRGAIAGYERGWDEEDERGLGEDGLYLPAERTAGFEAAMAARRAARRARAASPLAGSGVSGVGAAAYNAPPRFVTSRTDRRLAGDAAARREEAEERRRLREGE